MRHRLSRISLIMLLLVAVECRSANKEPPAAAPPATPQERPRDAVLASLVSKLPADFPAVVAFYPSRVAGAEVTVRAMLAGLPLGDGPIARRTAPPGCLSCRSATTSACAR